MGTIQIISASAGSGKTYRLTEILKEELQEKRVRPESVVATTFTNKAAAELIERVRSALIKAGRTEDAQVLSTARIGTVNSVAGRLVSDFAFELGISPVLRVLDEVHSATALKRSLSQVVDRQESDALSSVASRWSDFDWQYEVSRVLDFARVNRIQPGKLKDFAEASLEGFLALREKPIADEQAWLDDLKAALRQVPVAVKGLPKEDVKANEAAKQAIKFLQKLESGPFPKWGDWAGLFGSKPKKLVKQIVDPVLTMTNQHTGLARFAEDAGQLIRAVFDIAAKALDAYEKHKAERGLIDFVDQEVLAIKALQDKSVRDRLEGNIDLVLVDEFQDTSPLQLCLFLELASLARKSVWVGDQKQAIYGFRGTDPKLMDAAMEAILKGADPETLNSSHRSRPELVRLCSDVFAGAFSGQKIPEKLVRLEPHEDREPENLGPFVERWVLETKNKDMDAAAIAAGVKRLCEDPSQLVRDKSGKTARKLTRRDVAVLCRKNDDCKNVAGALEEAGLEAVIPREGLFAQPEGQLVMAGLRLWLDPEDRLAAAEVTRLIEHPDDPSGWLGEVIESASNDRLPASETIDRIAKARAQAPLAGPVEALDEVMEATSVRELCLAWGSAKQRLSNLDSIRQHAVYWAQDAQGTGSALTVTGLIAYLDELSSDGKDNQAVQAGDDAVTVTTWHGAKGLEWPVVVVWSLDSKSRASALGVQVVEAEQGFSLEDPLKDRWIRFWPNPYPGNRKNSALHERLFATAEHKEAELSSDRERLRLLYVCWTRARDRLILPERPSRLASGALSLLEKSGECLICDVAKDAVDEADEDLTWAGRRFPVRVRRLSPVEPVERVPAPGEGPVPAGPVEHPPAWISPSSLEVSGKLLSDEKISEGFKIPKKADLQALGEAMHAFFAADRDGLGKQGRLEVAEGIIERMGLFGIVDPEVFLRSGDSLKAWVDTRWKKARWHRELVLQHRLQSGSVVSGFCDLALERDAGWVVLDHKVIGGKAQEILDNAKTYAGQLNAYSAAIEAATGKPVEEAWIHLPAAGRVVRVGSHQS